MFKGKHIMIAVIILLLSLVNLAIYSYWDIPSEEDWKLGLNYTFFITLILILESTLIVAGITAILLINWDRWWNWEFNLNK